MNVSAYLRVSTLDQNTDTQLKAILKYCASNGWVLSSTYIDRGISGAKDTRPELDRLKQDVINGAVDTLIVWKFDRLARSTSHLLECLQLFQKHDTSFISVTEGIDTSTAVGRMVYTFLGAIGEFERCLIRERVKAGLERVKAEGVILGRPTHDFDIEMAHSLRKSGMSFKAMSIKMGVSVGKIHKELKKYTDVHKTSAVFGN